MVTMVRKPTKPTNQTNQSNQLDSDANNNENISVENKLIVLLKQQPDITTKEIMKNIGITNNQVKYYIKKLKDDGKIERLGTNRKGSWRVM